MKNMWYSLLIISSIFSATLCYAGNAAKQGSYVKILEIQPNPSIPLKSGSEVLFKVKIEYKVKEDSGTLNLIIQKGEYSGGFDTLIGSAMEVLTHGEGHVTLEKQIRVPDTQAIQVFTPLMIPGETRTSIVDMRSYKVIK